MTKGLLARFEFRHETDAEANASLDSLLSTAAAGPALFIARFHRSHYGLFAAFPNEAERNEFEAHGLDAFGATAVLATEPSIVRLDILANKLPTALPATPDRKGLLLTFKAKPGNETGVEEFLRNALELVNAEPDTTAWFAIRLETGEYGIFDVFPDHEGRFKHLTGHVARGLATHALSLLGSLPDPELPDIIGERLVVAQGQ